MESRVLSDTFRPAANTQISLIANCGPTVPGHTRRVLPAHQAACDPPAACIGSWTFQVDAMDNCAIQWLGIGLEWAIP